MQREMLAPSEAGQAACGSGKASLSSGPIYFNLVITTPAAWAGSLGTQLFASVEPSFWSSI